MEIDDSIRDIFEDFRSIAVYGMSQNTEKPSYRVPAYMLSNDYNIIPINPNADKILDRKSYPDLVSVPEEIEVLNVFRPADQILALVAEAIERKRRKGDIDVIWLQSGIKNDEAKRLAVDAGFTFIQDKCMMMEYQKIFDSAEEA